MELIGNNPITANGVYTLRVDPGRRYAFGASSAAWSGSLAVQWVDNSGNATSFAGSPLIAPGNLEFTAPSGMVQFVMSGTTQLQIVPVIY